VRLLTDEAHNLEAKLLRLLGLAMMLADERLEALRKADEPYGQRAVLEHFAHFIVRAEPIRIDPDALPHQERIILALLARLDFEALKKLLEDQIHHLVQLSEKGIDVMVRKDAEAGQ